MQYGLYLQFACLFYVYIYRLKQKNIYIYKQVKYCSADLKSVNLVTSSSKSRVSSFISTLKRSTACIFFISESFGI